MPRSGCTMIPGTWGLVQTANDTVCGFPYVTSCPRVRHIVRTRYALVTAADPYDTIQLLSHQAIHPPSRRPGIILALASSRSLRVARNAHTIERQESCRGDSYDLDAYPGGGRLLAACHTDSCRGSRVGHTVYCQAGARISAKVLAGGPYVEIVRNHAPVRSTGDLTLPASDPGRYLLGREDMTKCPLAAIMLLVGSRMQYLACKENAEVWASRTR
jgi:hypothetical protein